MEEFLPQIAREAPVVAVVVIFIWYLARRNGKMESAMKAVASKLEALTEKIHDHEE